MPKAVSFRKGVLSVLFWSIISAAFIGPGTVTTASSAGAAFQLDLLWALVFSIIATIILQEAAARTTIASGKSLGEIIALKYAHSGGRRLKLLLFLAVAVGCAAYQAGNLLGALSGLALFGTLRQAPAVLGLGVACAGLLWLGNFRTIAHFLGVIVAFMGLTFLYVSFQIEIDALDMVKAGLLPRFPEGSTLLIISLIGTTIVPYNLFLASGISQEQSMREMRWGIAVAVLIGGLISVSILVVGTSVQGLFSFESLAQALAASLGSWSIAFFGLGLFAAGFSSSITAPLAAAVTGQSLFGAGSPEWTVRSRNFRLIWGTVLAIGLLFGSLDVRPIPVIILAQAVNGLLLPVVAVFLLLAVNDRDLIPAKYVNSAFNNVLMLLIVGVTCFLGLNNIWKAMLQVFPALDNWRLAYGINLSLSILILIVLGWRLWRPDGSRR